MYEIMSPTLTVASAKDHFSEVLEKVEAGASIRFPPFTIFPKASGESFPRPTRTSAPTMFRTM